MAFRDAFIEASPKLLEPIQDLEILVPEDLMGEVMTDLQGATTMTDSIHEFFDTLAKILLRCWICTGGPCMLKNPIVKS